MVLAGRCRVRPSLLDLEPAFPNLRKWLLLLPRLTSHAVCAFLLDTMRYDRDETASSSTCHVDWRPLCKALTLATCKCVHPSEPAPSLIPVSVLVLVPVQVFCTLYSRATRPIRIAPPPRFPSAGPLITASTRAFTDSHVDLQLARLCCALLGAQGLAGTPDRELLNTYLARPRPWQRHALDARLHCGLNSLKVFNGLFCTP